MQWSKAKTIIIVVLIAANAFLYYSLRQLYQSQIYLTKNFVEASIVALEKNNISVSKETIPTKKATLPVLFYNMDVTQYDNFAARLLSSDMQESYDSDNNKVYTSSEAQFVAEDSGYFEYKVLNYDTDAPEISEGEAVSLTNTFISLAGIDESNYRIIQKVKSGNNYTIGINQYINGVPVTDYSMTIILCGNKIISAKGKLIVTKQINSIPNEENDAINTLFSLASAVKDKLTVLKIHLLYMPFITEQKSEITLTPMYEIITDGGTYMYDLSTGQLIK